MIDTNDVALIVVRSYSDSAGRMDRWVDSLDITSSLVPNTVSLRYLYQVGTA